MRQGTFQKTYIYGLRKAHKDKQVIKIIAGLRRVGKSTILKLYADELKKMDAGEDHILTVNLEGKENSHLLYEGALYRFVMSKVPGRAHFTSCWTRSSR